MKKLIIAALTAAMLLSLAGCSSGNTENTASAAATEDTVDADYSVGNGNDILMIRYTSVSMIDDGLEDAEECIQTVLNSVTYDPLAEDETLTDTENTISYEGSVYTCRVGDFLVDIDTDKWDILANYGECYKLTYKLSDDIKEDYSYEIVISRENGEDRGEIKKAILAFYKNSATFECETEEEINGLPFSRINGVLHGDGSAMKSDLSLLFCQPGEQAN